MDSVAKEILEYLGNTHTKTERKPGFMGNYYSPLIDTIYIAENFENMSVPNGAENINKKAAELIVVCHECIHSVQSKTLHLLNTLFANLAVILFIVYIVTLLLDASVIWIKVTTIVTLVANIIIRLILEMGATSGSTKLAKEAVSRDLVEGVTTEDVEASTEYINKHKLFALMQMVLDKIIFLTIALIV